MHPPLFNDWLIFDPPLLDPVTGALFVGCRGDLEWFNALNAGEELHAVCEQAPRYGRVVVSLGEERFVDLVGLRVLIDATDHARRTGRSLALANVPRSLVRMVEVLGRRADLEFADRSAEPPLTLGSGEKRAD